MMTQVLPDDDTLKSVTFGSYGIVKLGRRLFLEGTSDLIYSGKNKMGEEFMVKAYQSTWFLDKEIDKEVEFYTSLRSPFLIRLCEHVFISDEKTLYCLFPRYLFTLEDFLRQHDVSLENKKRMMTRCAKALEVLHARGVMHRNISPRSFYLNTCEDLVICDFSGSKAAHHNEQLFTQTGDAVYASPEMNEARPHEFSTDVYSLGSVFCRILQVQEKTKPVDVKKAPRQLRDLLKGMLKKRPEKRVGIQKVVSMLAELG